MNFLLVFLGSIFGALCLKYFLVDDIVENLRTINANLEDIKFRLRDDIENLDKNILLTTKHLECVNESILLIAKEMNEDINTNLYRYKSYEPSYSYESGGFQKLVDVENKINSKSD